MIVFMAPKSVTSSVFLTFRLFQINLQVLCSCSQMSFCPTFITSSAKKEYTYAGQIALKEGFFHQFFPSYNYKLLISDFVPY